MRLNPTYNKCASYRFVDSTWMDHPNLLDWEITAFKEFFEAITDRYVRPHNYKINKKDPTKFELSATMWEDHKSGKLGKPKNVFYQMSSWDAYLICSCSFYKEKVLNLYHLLWEGYGSGQVTPSILASLIKLYPMDLMEMAPEPLSTNWKELCQAVATKLFEVIDLEHTESFNDNEISAEPPSDSWDAGVISKSKAVAMWKYYVDTDGKAQIAYDMETYDIKDRDFEDLIVEAKLLLHNSYDSYDK